MYSELSVGCSGSWCWSCVTRSLRKSSLPSAATLSLAFSSGLVVAVGVVVVIDGAGGVVAIEVTYLLLGSGSGEDVDESVAGVQPLGGQAERLVALEVVGTGIRITVGGRTALPVAVGLRRRAVVR